MRMAYLCLQATRQGQASYTHVNEIIRGLRARGIEVDLFEPAYSGRERLPGALGRLWGFLGAQARLVPRLRRYDALYVRGHFGTFPTVLAASLLRVPMAYEINGPQEDLFLAWPWTRRIGWIFEWLHSFQIRRADAVITVTEDLGRWITSLYPGTRVRVVPNGADTLLFHPGAPASRELPGRFALFFGAMAPWQGLGTVMEAVQRPEWPADLDLVVVGDGVMRPLVEQEAARNGRVHYLGKQPYREVPGIAAAATVSLVPCTNPGGRASTGLFPLKLFESMASGVPVVVTDFPGQADLVRKTACGLVIPAGDGAALAGAVARICSDPGEARAMGLRGREAAVNEHSWDQRAAQTLVVLAEAMGGRT